MEGNDNLTRESAEILCIRGTAPVENGTKPVYVKITGTLWMMLLIFVFQELICSVL